MTEFRPGTALRAALILLLACIALRLADVFWIRSDEWFGEQFVTKALGILLAPDFRLSLGSEHGMAFAIAMLIGPNMMNAVMEEGLFRGVLLRQWVPRSVLAAVMCWSRR